MCSLLPDGHSPEATEGLITARKRSLRRLCFHRCLSVSRQTPPRQTLPPPMGRHHPPRQKPPWADTPPAPCMLGYTPPAQCMLGYTPPCPVHAGINTPPPPPSTCWDTVNKRAVRIPLECILVNYVVPCSCIRPLASAFRTLSILKASSFGSILRAL